MTIPGMIFAAGFGTRMGELTKETPKPLLSLGGKPMIDQAIDLLQDAGVSPIVANTHYLPERLEPHLAEKGVTILREEKILETGGGLRAALPHLGTNPVITMNPDVLWVGQNPVSSLISSWQSHMQALLLLVPTDGGVQSDFSLESGEIRRGGPYLYTGLQILRTDWLDEIEAPIFSLNAYWDLLLARGPLHGVVYDGTWMDIGTQQGLEEANRRLAE